MAQMRIWNGTDWEIKTDLKLWSGTEWSSKQGFVYDGTSWQEFTKPQFVLNSEVNLGSLRGSSTRYEIFYVVDVKAGHYYLSENGKIHKRRISDGVNIWSHTLSSGYNYPLEFAVDSVTKDVYVRGIGSDAQFKPILLIKINSAGTIAYRTTQPNATATSPTATAPVIIYPIGNKVLVNGSGSNTRYFYAIDKTTGEVVSTGSDTSTFGSVGNHYIDSSNDYYYTRTSQTTINLYALNEQFTVMSTTNLTGLLGSWTYGGDGYIYTTRVSSNTRYFEKFDMSSGSKETIGTSRMFTNHSTQQVKLLPNKTWIIIDMDSSKNDAFYYKILMYDANGKLTKIKDVSYGWDRIMRLDYVEANKIVTVWENNNSPYVYNLRTYTDFE